MLVWNQAITWINADLFSVGISGTHFNELSLNPNILIQEMHLKLYLQNIGYVLTQWGWVMHICINKLTITGSDNGLLPHRHKAIICPNAGILLIGPLGTYLSEISIKLYPFSFKEMLLKCHLQNGSH